MLALTDQPTEVVPVKKVAAVMKKPSAAGSAISGAEVQKRPAESTDTLTEDNLSEHNKDLEAQNGQVNAAVSTSMKHLQQAATKTARAMAQLNGIETSGSTGKLKDLTVKQCCMCYWK